MKTIFLFWLHNIYQRPFKYMLNPNARHLNELFDNGLVVKHEFDRLRITPKGKKILIQNLPDLSEDHSLLEVLNPPVVEGTTPTGRTVKEHTQPLQNIPSPYLTLVQTILKTTI